MDEGTIQFALWAKLLGRGHKAVMPNVSWSWLYWEADLISVTKADYWHEYEIKCAKSDFIKDFEKPKHRQLRHAIRYPARVPNYFWYVAPIKAIPLCIPDYAGLMVATDVDDEHGFRTEVETVRGPTLLHTSKLTTEGYTAMLRSVMFKYWDMMKINADIRCERDRKCKCTGIVPITRRCKQCGGRLK